MRGRWETTRIEAFSDGVFAIAITLLVLDIAVPESELDHAIGRASTPNIGFYGTMTAFALLAPRAAAFGDLVLALVSVARVRSHRRDPAAA